MSYENPTPYQDAVDLLQAHDGMRFEAVKSLIVAMKLSDIQLITDFALQQERNPWKSTQE